MTHFAHYLAFILDSNFQFVFPSHKYILCSRDMASGIPRYC